MEVTTPRTMASDAQDEDEEEPRQAAAHQNGCPTAKWNGEPAVAVEHVAVLARAPASARRWCRTGRAVPPGAGRGCRPRRAARARGACARRRPTPGVTRITARDLRPPAARRRPRPRTPPGGGAIRTPARAPGARCCRRRRCCRRWPRPAPSSGLISRPAVGGAVHLGLGDHVDHGAELVALESAHVVGAAGVEALLGRDEVAASGWRRPPSGEKITPPRTCQLSTTSRESGRYQAASATTRVNCWNEAEPRNRELTVTSSDLRLPREGSIRLLTRGTEARPVSVAEHPVLPQELHHVRRAGVERGAEAHLGGLGAAVAQVVGQRERNPAAELLPPQRDRGAGLPPQVHPELRAPLGVHRDREAGGGVEERRPADGRAEVIVQQRRADRVVGSTSCRSRRRGPSRLGSPTPTLDTRLVRSRSRPLPPRKLREVQPRPPRKQSSVA